MEAKLAVFRLWVGCSSGRIHTWLHFYPGTKGKCTEMYVTLRRPRLLGNLVFYSVSTLLTMLHLSCGGGCTQGHAQSPHLTHTALTAFPECSSLQRAKHCVSVQLGYAPHVLSSGSCGVIFNSQHPIAQRLLKPNSVAQPGSQSSRAGSTDAGSC